MNVSMSYNYQKERDGILATQCDTMHYNCYVLSIPGVKITYI